MIWRSLIWNLGVVVFSGLFSADRCRWLRKENKRCFLGKKKSSGLNSKVIENMEEKKGNPNFARVFVILSDLFGE